MARQALPNPTGTIEGTCPKSLVPAAGEPAGSRFFAFDETLEAGNLNRAAWALQQNVDWLFGLSESVYVVAPAGGDGDYVGGDALSDAIADGCQHIFVRDGSYEPTIAISFSVDGGHIVGESRTGVVIDCVTNGVAISVDGDGVRLSRMTVQVDGASTLTVTGEDDQLDQLTVAGSVLVAGAADSVRMVDCSVTCDPGVAAAGYAALWATAGRVIADGCFFDGNDKLALTLSGAVVATLSHCRFEAAEQVADVALIFGRLSVDNCSFSNPAGSAAYTTAFVSFVSSFSDTPPISMRNCSFSIVSCSRAAAVAPYIAFSGVHARDISIVTDTYHCDDCLLQVAYGMIKNLYVSFPASAPTVTGSTVIGAIHVSSGGTIEDAFAVGMAGTWPLSVFYVASSSSSILYPATLDTVRVAEGALWSKTTPGMLVRLGNFGRLRRLYWDDHAISNAILSDSIVSVLSSTTNYEGVEITDCSIKIVTPACARITSLLYISVDSGAGDIPGIRVLRNRFHITVVQVGTAMPTYTTFAVHIKGQGPLSAATSETGGNQYGEFCDNIVRFSGYIVGSGANDAPAAGPVMFGAYVYLWQICRNTIISNAGAVLSGHHTFIYCVENVGGVLAGLAGGCNVVSGNVLRELTSITYTPMVASPDGANAVGFYDGVTDIGNYLVKP